MKIIIILTGICLLLIWGFLGRIWVLFRRESQDITARKKFASLLVIVGVLGSLCFLIPLLGKLL